MATGNHIIHRLVFHIEVPRRSMAKKVQDEVSRQFEDVLLKQLNQLLDSIDIPGHVVIDTLNLDLGTATLENINEALPGILAKALQAAINPVPVQDTEAEEAANKVLKLTEQQKAFEVFIYFLQTGKLPWYADAETAWLKQEAAWLEQISTAITANASYKKEILALMTGSENALNRLFNQFSNAFIKKLTSVLWGVSADELQHYVDYALTRILKNKPSQNTSAEPEDHSPAALVFFEKLLLAIALLIGKYDNTIIKLLQKWAAAVNHSLNYNMANPIQVAGDMIQLIQVAGDKNISRHDTPPKDAPAKKTAAPEKETNEPQIPKSDDAEGTFIGQAGLVILHPFLEYFFKDFGLLQSNDFVDLHARELAVHLLYFLATGKLNPFEYDLGFEKFVCNWPAEKVINRAVLIPKSMQNEANNMLLTVIKYWKSLKNTSPEGLREAFLQRNGKLISTEEPVRIVVEKKDMDVLLATLPWGMGVIKLPWINKPFYVEWA